MSEKTFDFNGRPAVIAGTNVGTPSDPMNRFGPPRSIDKDKRRRMLAAKRKRGAPRAASRGRKN